MAQRKALQASKFAVGKTPSAGRVCGVLTAAGGDAIGDLISTVGDLVSSCHVVDIVVSPTLGDVGNGLVNCDPGLQVSAFRRILRVGWFGEWG